MCGYVHMNVLKEARGMGSSGAGVIELSQCELWELNSSPSEEQQVLWTPESSLQPPYLQ